MAFMLLARRLGAWILDLVPCLSVFLFLDTVVYKPIILGIVRRHYPEGRAELRSLWDAMEPGEKSVIFVLFLLAAWVIPSLYYAFFESSRWQATPGKRLLRLMVTRISGEPVSWWRALGRFWGRVLCGLLWPATVVSAVTILATDRNQALHDMMARCVVRVRAK